MPIYAYKCSSCSHDFEELIFSKDAETRLVCPSCRSKAITRQMAAFALTGGSKDSGPNCAGGT